MSLEIAIQENTAAIRELIAKLANGPAIANDPPAPAAVTKKVETKAEAKAAAAVSAPAEAPAQEAANEVTYDVLKKAVVDVVAKKGQAPVLALFASYATAEAPVKKADQIPKDKWPEALKKLQDEIAA